MSNQWRIAEDYRPEMGRVMVWLQWPEYSRMSGTLEPNGTFGIAYKLPLTNGFVWVDAKDCIPIENGGRLVTHFLQPEQPQ